MNEKFYTQDNIIEELHTQLKQCKEITKKDFYVIGLGGKESWLTTLAALEVFGYQNVLAVNIYSIFSNSVLPQKMANLCQENNIQYCDIDITAAVQETLSVPIGLFRIEKEKLHYMMSDLQKSEIIAMIRNAILRGVADRHDGTLLTGISLSKIISGWVSPSASMFDWNPLVNCTHYQVQLSITGYNMGIEILNLPSGLDLDTKGGPFPLDYGLNFTEDENLDKNTKDTMIKNIGIGIYQ